MNDLYRDEILDHYRHPQNFGELEGADRTARIANPLCGDTVQLSLKFEGDARVVDARFVGQGCALSIAATSMLTEFVKGKDLRTLGELRDADIFDLVGIKPGPMRQKCVLLVFEALKQLLAQNTR